MSSPSPFGGSLYGILEFSSLRGSKATEAISLLSLKIRHCERSEAISRNSKFILKNSKFILRNYKFILRNSKFLLAFRLDKSSSQIS